MESFIFSSHKLKQKFTNAAIRDLDLFAKKRSGQTDTKLVVYQFFD